MFSKVPRIGMEPLSDDRGSAVLDYLTPDISDGNGYRARERDLTFLGLTLQDIDEWRSRECPLGLTQGQYTDLVLALRDALKRDEIPLSDCDVRLKGSSATFYSGAHKRMPTTRDEVIDLYRELRSGVPYVSEVDEIMDRFQRKWIQDGDFPARRPFDSMHRLGISREPSDVDIQISSATVDARCRALLVKLGQSPTDARLNHPVYNFLKRDLVEDVAPSLFLFSLRMTRYVDRNVNVVVFPAEGPPDVSASQPVSSHFRSDDWILSIPALAQREALP
jgi:hypothetical protein